MQNITVDSFFYADLCCPRCGTKIINQEEGDFEVKQCEHIIFIASDEGFEFAKDPKLLEEYERLQEDEENYDLSMQDYLLKQKCDDGFMITCFAGAPACMGAYTGFDFSYQ